MSLRIGIVGTGHMAQTFALALETVDGLSLAGFASRDAARARDIAGQRGGEVYADTDALLADPTIDAVYVAHENAGHAAVALAALEAGKAVLCEKPCGITTAEVQALAEAAARYGRLFMEAIPTPFLPAVSQALKAAQDGTIGEPRHLAASFGYPANELSHPGCFAQHGGGVLLDRSIYLIALALIALGPARLAHAHIVRDSKGVDVEASLMLAHDNGATSMLSASLRSELDNRLHIAGTGGYAAVDAPLLAGERGSLVTTAAPGRPPAPGAGLGDKLRRSGLLRRGAAVARSIRQSHLSYGGSLYAGEIVHFRDLLRSGAKQSPILPPSFSVSVHALLDEARSSAP
jgi:predicted dehydrogenase